MVFLKKIVWGTFKNIAESLEIIELNAACFIVDDPIEVLIAETQLNIQPILRSSLFFKYLLYTQLQVVILRYLMYTLHIFYHYIILTP